MAPPTAVPVLEFNLAVNWNLPYAAFFSQHLGFRRITQWKPSANWQDEFAVAYRQTSRSFSLATWPGVDF
jgi:hypothetical protein